MSWELQCANCDKMVALSRKRYMYLFDANLLPLCGQCRRYARHLDLESTTDPRRTGGYGNNPKRKQGNKTRLA
jgi:hypothetical protein